MEESAVDQNEEAPLAATGSSSSPDEGIRRSGRKRASTIMIINGHAVKRANNYVLKGGTYSHGVYTEDEQKKAAASSKKPKKQGGPRTTEARKVSASETARVDFNNNVKKSVQSKEPLRRDFLVRNRELIEPFMDENTKRMVDNWGQQKKPAKKFEKHELFAQPELVEGGEMRDYQLAGLNFMVEMHQQNLGMILGDEMGLGKTLQTISLLCYLKEHLGQSGPSLVVCPLSVLYSWCSEAQKWAPSLKVLRLHATNSEDQANQRRELVEHATEYDLVVTTYEMIKVQQLQFMFNRIHFRYLVLDEGHKIKSGLTLVAQAVRRLHCENRLLLTGTPLQNNLSELVQLLNFLLPDIFNNFEPFENAFDITNNVIDKEKMMQAQKVLGLFMIRRLKNQVEKLMPKKIETKVYCPLSRNQIFWYKAILMKDLSYLERHDNKDGTVGATAAQKLAGLFMQLRKACLHPFLFDGAEPDIGATTLEQLIGASGKLSVLDSLLQSLFKKGHRCVIFSQFTSMLDILTDYCSMRGWRHHLFDGRTSRARRNYFVNAFNAKNSDVFLFLMSTRSGSMGLNLQTADTVILFDSDFNPQMDIQAQARVHRIGQKKTVHVYRLVAGGTVEERLVERAEKKLLLDQMVNRDRPAGGAPDPNEKESFSGSEMLKDIKFGSAAVFGDSSLNSLPAAKDIEFITDRKRSEVDSDGKLKGNVFHKGDTFDVTKELSASQTFQGIDFKKLRQVQKGKGEEDIPTSLRGISRMWVDNESKRKKKSRVVMVKGKNSGYGQAMVPVLASNNYDLENGESSVFDRELSSKAKDSYTVKKHKRAKVPDHQEYCQVCGDGGTIYLCSRCPVSVHRRCCATVDNMQPSCPHHWCCLCEKPAQFVGGILFPCQACPNAYCEDCLPTGNPGFRYLEQCDRFEQMGFNSTKTSVYIHCSNHCEEYAKQNLGWKAPSTKRQSCPKKIDVSAEFGGEEEGSTEVTQSAAAAVAPPTVSTLESSSSSGSESGVPATRPGSAADAAIDIDLSLDDDDQGGQEYM
ncbi:ISWI chromatin-remodeling complex ATPase ISW2 [Seminavis robusta]|uniref:ISWI chromatin-remodeling complex ATPase ISW2 n=1 Tax=Seminavis robusta TaxID=568900 RepID=A0A9N8EFA7_9STRA|nr:ISWI chromatin-remodeling complex ATPase ISW2 [Seminavis robusta]|eukprot:Sro860_g212120.1 ISWI chromatin-remodeling complex ATPase ISW2 (1031) ;mRNA; r:13713-17314